MVRVDDQQQTSSATLTPSHLTSLWPDKDSSHATPDEIKMYPLHAKQVARHAFSAFRQFLDPVLHFLFDKYSSVFVAPEVWAGDPALSSKQPPDTNELSDADIAELALKGLIRIVQRSEVRGWAFSFSVLEQQKQRRRWILHTRALNRSTSALKFSISTRNYDRVKYRYAVCVDIKFYFGAFAMSPEAGRFFCFEHNGVIYAPTTMPTGARQCPGLAQIWSENLAAIVFNKLRAESGGLAVETYLDNFRLCSDDPRTLKKALEFLYELGTLVEFNEDLKTLLQRCDDEIHGVTPASQSTDENENTTLTQYNFLGVRYNHLTQSITITQKTREKLATMKTCLTAVSQNDFVPTLRNCLSWFGVATFASHILDEFLGDYYYILKFMRRNCGEKLTSQIVVWPSILPLWTTWIEKLCNSKPRHVLPALHVSSRRQILITDASDSGFGVIFITIQNILMVTAGKWHERTTDKNFHINLKESWTVLYGIGYFQAVISNKILLETFVDNTTAKYVLEKGYSRSFALTQIAKKLKKLCLRLLLQMAITWICSSAMWADDLSRGKHTIMSQTIHHVAACLCNDRDEMLKTLTEQNTTSTSNMK